MHWMGFDVGKAFHWVCVLDGEGEVVLSRRVEATEEQLEVVLSEIAGMGGPEERVVGIDILGGPATLLEALLLARGERVRYIPGTAVNRARDAYAGGERKSDPGDAFVIADQVRMRWRSLSEVRARSEELEEVRVLVGHRADLVQERIRAHHAPERFARGGVPRPGGRAGPEEAGAIARGHQGGDAEGGPQARQGAPRPVAEGEGRPQVGVSGRKGGGRRPPTAARDAGRRGEGRARRRGAQDR